MVIHGDYTRKLRALPTELRASRALEGAFWSGISKEGIDWDQPGEAPEAEGESIQREFPNFPSIAAEFFYRWCLGVIAVLWNTNVDVLMPVFAPLTRRFKLGDQPNAPAGLSEASDDG